ncbi:hypothetical protein [Desulfovibrio inopinatus]|uniref:hypothetical protein n=1 Tax=Desulfovibrio inopinatus TaxID=102109 RepID=UPI000410BDCB|nr:hypothetical protein [Desulfovibrio inopinatus]
MISRRKTDAVLKRLGKLYQEMDAAYTNAASALGLSCVDCENNCCTSYFQHHTHIEWLYLFRGLEALPEETRARYIERAKEYVEAVGESLSRGEVPTVMCPLNDDGRCAVYDHRLMICRLHGVPNVILSRNGLQHFQGCFKAKKLFESNPEAPVMDRTAMYRALAGLEMELLGKRKTPPPRIDLTLAQMLVMGPPSLK